MIYRGISCVTEGLLVDRCVASPSGAENSFDTLINSCVFYSGMFVLLQLMEVREFQSVIGGAVGDL